MTPTHLLIAFIAGALLATVATWYAKRALLRSNANLRAKLAAADDTLAALRAQMAILNAANHALRTEQERAQKAYRSVKSANETLRRSLGQHRRERRVQP